MSKLMKKGNLPISSKQVAATMSFVAKAQQELADAPSLNTTDRQRALKLKNGAQLVVPTIAALVKKYELRSKHVTMDEAESTVAYAASLRALVGPTTLLLKRIKDEILRSEGDAWKSATVSYGMLQSIATGVPDLAIELAAVEQWFRRGHLRGKAARAAGAKAPAAAAAGKPAAAVEPVKPAASVNPPPQA